MLNTFIISYQYVMQPVRELHFVKHNKPKNLFDFLRNWAYGLTQLHKTGV